MQRPVSSKFVDVGSLSSREREVVARAVEGYTDEQIAQSAGIRLGTVNTYWVRIRAKVGQLSRTEIVAGVLRREMESRCENLEREISRLTSDRPPASQPSADVGDAEEPWRFKCLGYLCDAALVVGKTGEVLYANPHARAMLRADRHELEGVPFWELTASESGKSCEQGLHDFFANQVVRRAVLGLDAPYYGRRRDGSTIRITIAAEWFESPDGIIASVSLREYMNGSSGHAAML